MIYFVRTRHHYVPYDDLWTLARLSGYTVISIDDIPQHDAHDAVFIISPFNHEWENGIQLSGRLILWELEWRETPVSVPGLTETWASNLTYANRLGVKFVPLGSHSGLNTANGAHYPKRYDVTHLSYAPPRRQTIYHHFEMLGGTIAPTGWGAARDASLLESYAMLYVSQWDAYPAVAPLRLAICAAYGLPMIAERGWSIEPIKPHLLFMDEYLKLAETAFMLTRPQYYSTLADVGANLRYQLCEVMPFRRCVEEAL